MSPFQPIPAVNPNDPQSMARAIQVINNNFQTLVRLGNFIDPRDPTNISGGGTGLKPSGGNFTEKRQSRTVVKERIFNPQDKEQYVDVEQVTGLTFVDGQTGRTLVFKL